MEATSDEESREKVLWSDNFEFDFDSNDDLFREEDRKLNK